MPVPAVSVKQFGKGICPWRTTALYSVISVTLCCPWWDKFISAHRWCKQWQSFKRSIIRLICSRDDTLWLFVCLFFSSARSQMTDLPLADGGVLPWFSFTLRIESTPHYIAHTRWPWPTVIYVISTEIHIKYMKMMLGKSLIISLWHIKITSKLHVHFG